jgi:hypothetical protein
MGDNRNRKLCSCLNCHYQDACIPKTIIKAVVNDTDHFEKTENYRGRKNDTYEAGTSNAIFLPLAAMCRKFELIEIN